MTATTRLVFTLGLALIAGSAFAAPRVPAGVRADIRADARRSVAFYDALKRPRVGIDAVTPGAHNAAKVRASLTHLVSLRPGLQPIRKVYATATFKADLARQTATRRGGWTRNLVMPGRR